MTDGPGSPPMRDRRPWTRRVRALRAESPQLARTDRSNSPGSLPIRGSFRWRAVSPRRGADSRSGIHPHFVQVQPFQPSGGRTALSKHNRAESRASAVSTRLPFLVGGDHQITLAVPQSSILDLDLRLRVITPSAPSRPHACHGFDSTSLWQFEYAEKNRGTY